MDLKECISIAEFDVVVVVLYVTDKFDDVQDPFSQSHAQS